MHWYFPNVTALICVSNARVIPRNAHISTQYQHNPFWSGVIILYFIIYTILCELDYFGSLTLFQNKYNTLLFIWWRVWMRLITDMILVDVQMTKINALVLWFFHITIHSPFGFVHCSDEKIAGRVHWFLSFALQQNQIQSLTSNLKVIIFTLFELQNIYSFCNFAFSVILHALYKN